MVFVCFIDTLHGGGVERICLDQAGILCHRGHQVLLVPFDADVRMPIPDRCLLVKGHNFFRPAEKEIHRLLERYHCPPDEVVFLFHMRRSTSYLAKNIGFFSDFGKTCCLFLHSNISYSYGIVSESPLKSLKPKHILEFWRIPKILKKSRTRLEELLLIQKHCRIFAVSASIREECESFGIHDVSILENGVDLDRINTLAARYARACEGEYIVHVARLSEEKRQEMLVRAFARSGSELKLVIVGDGPLRTDLEKLAAELNIADSVVFAGFVENPYPLIKGAKFSVVCSRWEGFGLSIAESLCLATPVLMTDCPYGVRRLLGAYDERLICADSEEALAERIATLSEAGQIEFKDGEFLERISLERVMYRFLSEIKN